MPKALSPFSLETHSCFLCHIFSELSQHLVRNHFLSDALVGVEQAKIKIDGVLKGLTCCRGRQTGDPGAVWVMEESGACVLLPRPAPSPQHCLTFGPSLLEINHLLSTADFLWLPGDRGFRVEMIRC